MDENDPNPEPDGQTFHYTCPSTDSLSYTVIRAVSAVTGDDPRHIEPLYESVDPDALEAMIRAAETRSEGTVAISFDFHNCHITVTGSGDVRIRPRAAAIERSHPTE